MGIAEGEVNRKRKNEMRISGREIQRTKKRLTLGFGEL
jgi:hypothetical protein